MSVQFPSSLKGAYDIAYHYFLPAEPSAKEIFSTFIKNLFPKTEPKTFTEQASELYQQAWNIAANKYGQAEKGVLNAIHQGKLLGHEKWDNAAAMVDDAKKQVLEGVNKGTEKAGVIFHQILVPKVQETYAQADQFVANNSHEIAAGAAVIGGFAFVKGAQDLAEGKKKQGFAEMAAGILGIGTAGYLQSDTIIKPLINTITPYFMQAKDWIDDQMATSPQLATVTGLIGGGTLALGVNDLMKGNKKRGTVETIMGLAGISLSIYGLYGDKTCPAPNAKPAVTLTNTSPNPALPSQMFKI